MITYDDVRDPLWFLVGGVTMLLMISFSGGVI